MVLCDGGVGVRGSQWVSRGECWNSNVSDLFVFFYDYCFAFSAVFPTHRSINNLLTSLQATRLRSASSHPASPLNIRHSPSCIFSAACFLLMRFPLFSHSRQPTNAFPPLCSALHRHAVRMARERGGGKRLPSLAENSGGCGGLSTLLLQSALPYLPQKTQRQLCRWRRS